MGHAEVPVGHLPDVLAFLVAHNGHVYFLETGKTGDERRVVLELSVTMELDEIGEQIVNIIESVRPVQVT